MFKLDPKKRWGYSDLEKMNEISQHFEKYTKLDDKDDYVAKIKILKDEGESIFGAIERRKYKAKK